jgi:hypothetical protein
LVEDSVGDIECIGSRFSQTMCFNFNLLSSHSYSHVASISSAGWHWVGSLVNGTRTVCPSEIVRQSPTMSSSALGQRGWVHEQITWVDTVNAAC